MKFYVATTANWTKFDPLFNAAAKQYGVSAEHLKAFALNESLLGLEGSVSRGLSNPNDVEGSRSSDGLSWGLMQMTLTTAKSLDPSATPQKLNDPAYSISMGAKYIRQLQDSFSSQRADPRYWEYIVKSYNQGPGKTRQREIEKKSPELMSVNDYFARWVRNLQRVKGASVA